VKYHDGQNGCESVMVINDMKDRPELRMFSVELVAVAVALSADICFMKFLA